MLLYLFNSPPCLSVSAKPDPNTSGFQDWTKAEIRGVRRVCFDSGEGRKRRVTLLPSSGRGMMVRIKLESPQQSNLTPHLKSLGSKSCLSPCRGIRKLRHICRVSSNRGAVNPGPRWRCSWWWGGRRANTRYRALTPHNEMEEPVMLRWRQAHQLMSSSFLFPSQYKSIRLSSVSAAARLHSHTRTATGTWAVGNTEVKESLSGFLSAPFILHLMM